jgi:hypothetical protein
VDSVFFALRIKWADAITCDYETDPVNPTCSYGPQTQDFSMYDGIFDTFHYDIGHGKATHEGSVDSNPVRDGFSGRPFRSGPVGDWERDTGAAVSAWERPGQGRGYGY